MAGRPALVRLRIQWGVFAALFLAALIALTPLSQTWFSENRSNYWPYLTGLALAYFLGILWVNLPENHREGETDLLPNLGWGNAITVLRAFPMAMVVGFLFSARPEGDRAWLPGLLYTIAALPDFVDGLIARKTNHVTVLGGILDMNVDSIGVLAATFLAFQYGVVPWWYVPIGLARYLFVFGIWLRERRGLPVQDLPYSHRRRGFAALKMGFMFVILFPLFGPPGTHLAALAFGVPFAAGFLWDWGLVTGRIRPGSTPARTRFENLTLNILPLGLRLAALLLMLPTAIEHLQSGRYALLGLAEMLLTLLLLLGIAPRITAIAAVCLLGINQNIAPLSPALLGLIGVYIGMIFAGGGKWSLFPVENWLIYNRVGDEGQARAV